MRDETITSTEAGAYAERLGRLESVWWKRLLDVQRPYRIHLQRMKLGFVLEVGCGLGRNLVNLGGNGAGVGVDHNAEAIETCRARGLEAYLPDAFAKSDYAKPERFDTLLLAHVVEHMHMPEAKALIATYLPFVKRRGRVVLICPQEAGYASDPTHVEFMDVPKLERILRELGLTIEDAHSFPFPRAVGKVFKYNEFVVVGRLR